MTEPSLTADSLVARNEDVLYSEVADGMSLMDMESGNYYHYDGAGVDIWKAIDGQQNIATLCDGLRETHDVDAQTCLADTLAFLNELLGLGLVTVQQR